MRWWQISQYPPGKIKDNGSISTRQWHKDILVKSQKIVLAWNKFNWFFFLTGGACIIPSQNLDIVTFCKEVSSGYSRFGRLSGFRRISRYLFISFYYQVIYHSFNRSPYSWITEILTECFESCQKKERLEFFDYSNHDSLRKIFFFLSSYKCFSNYFLMYKVSSVIVHSFLEGIQFLFSSFPSILLSIPLFKPSFLHIYMLAGRNTL